MEMIKKVSSIFFLILIVISILPFGINNVYAQVVTKGDLGRDLCGPPTNPKNSLVLSIITMCIPGILEKLQEYKNNKCEEVKCYYNAVKDHLDPSFCTKQEAYQECKYMAGEMFAMPYLSAVEHLRNAMSQLLANPVGMGYSAFISYARHSVNNCKVSGTCASPTTRFLTLPLAFTDISAVIEYFKDFHSMFPSLSTKNQCDGIDSIKTEMKKIVNS